MLSEQTNGPKNSIGLTQDELEERLGRPLIHTSVPIPSLAHVGVNSVSLSPNAVDITKVELKPGCNYVLAVPDTWPLDQTRCREHFATLGAKVTVWMVPDPTAIRVFEIPGGVDFEEYMRRLEGAENKKETSA